MTRRQILTLAGLGMMVCVVFFILAITLRSNLTNPVASANPEPVTSAVPPSPTFTPGLAMVPTSTFTPPPAESSTPTATYTRVVVDTATPTPSQTPEPTYTPTPTSIPSATRSQSSGGGRSGGAPYATATPTSRYPFTIVEEPQVYSTTNHIFVVLAQVTSGGSVLVPGYRMVGTHSPSGASHQSEPSCDHLCKGSGPKGEFLIQEGNLVFEAPFYDTGTWSLMLVDPQGQQVSDVLKIEIDRQQKKWFFYHFNR
jgi:hypothetical protein